MGIFDDVNEENDTGFLQTNKIPRSETVIAYGGIIKSNNKYGNVSINDSEEKQKGIFDRIDDFDMVERTSINKDEHSNDFLGQENSLVTSVNKPVKSVIGIELCKSNLPKQISLKDKDILLSNQSKNLKKLSKRDIYKQKDNILASLKSLSDGDCNFIDLNQDNKYTKHTFNKKIFEEFGKCDHKYGMDIEELLKEIALEKHSDTQKLDSISKEKAELNNKLWVDKYKPSNFLNIVGHEDNKMNIMKWLKMWSLATGGASTKFCEENMHDPYRRPAKKVLLIEGKTGIGKNLLIEVLAKICNFSLIEVNGSDYINGNVKQWLSNIVHINNSVLGKKTVNCLLVDEASNDISDINSNLVDILKNDEKITKQCIEMLTKNSNKNELFKKLKSLKNQLLRKPIICLTDNISSRKLASLKPFCEIIKLKQPSLDDISSHLKNILCEEFGATDDMINQHNLNRFIEICNGDIRNCLNNLQFDIIDDSMNILASHKNKFKSEMQGKDKSQSWLKIMFDLFEPSNALKDLKSASNNFIRELDLLENSFSNMIQLSFDNYPNIVPNIENTTLKKYETNLNAVHENLFFWDMMNSSTDMNIRLSSYGLVTLLQFFNFNYNIYQGSSKSHKKLNRNLIKLNAWHPKMQQVKSDIKELIYSFKKPYEVKNFGFDSYVYSSYNSKQLAEELLPLLSSMVNVDFINSIKNAEKRDAVLLELWGLFKAKEISFIKKKGLNSYSLEISLSKNISLVNLLNNFESLSCFQEQYKFKDIGTDLLKNKQLDSIKRDSLYGALGLPIDSGMGLVNAGVRYNFTSKKFEEFKYQSIQKAKASKRKIIELQSQSFSQLNEPPKKLAKIATGNNEVLSNSLSFMIKKPTSEKIETAISSENDTGRTWIKYKEGFSNAVKKKVTWDTFFI
ncbi:hypothetical protein QEN19_002740 [Hanseniaspora menglaensis]